MRIIAGKYKGHVVKFPKSKLVRPTTDRVKESIFNYLNNIIDFDGIYACDLYAGSGSLGLETISRGAKLIDFVEKNYKVATVLRDNIARLKAVKFSQVFQKSCYSYTSAPCDKPYDLILADPPFFKNDIYNVINNIRVNDYLSEEGILLIERSIQTKDEDVKNFGIEPVKKLGDSLIYLYDKALLQNFIII
jgi:16S rRNA (guanine966-N2)-methyltransferase